ncbi:hypothetical protein EYF80_051346 [Liparis tanakae]|uniref:Uncharacterized protein n=1 Tax=Liparis tanakae TaxID=230148 RepID=A0A4Z2FBD6_9TELE|nr:hypothetical protein EYF80_051346 [Liparis tanakae]
MKELGDVIPNPNPHAFRSVCIRRLDHSAACVTPFTVTQGTRVCAGRSARVITALACISRLPRAPVLTDWAAPTTSTDDSMQ